MIENIDSYIERNNIKYYGSHTIMREENIIGRSINEIMRILATKTIEIEYAKEKYPEYCEIIDLDAREVFNTGIVIRALTKCVFSYTSME